MMIKYRVNEVARDFGVPGKEIIKLLEQYTGTTKKSQTALEENELDIIFEHYTQAHQEDNFDRYFAVAAEAEKKREEEKAAKREAEKAEKPPKRLPKNRRSRARLRRLPKNRRKRTKRTNRIRRNRRWNAARWIPAVRSR